MNTDISRLERTKFINFGVYRELSKSGIVALVLISVLGGYLAGHSFETPLDWIRLALTLIGVLGVASGSSALNHWQDREMDAQMPRTAKRPLPSGRISELHTLVFSFGMIIVGLFILSLLSWKLVVLGATAVFSYNILYTLWWKRTMPFAAVPGAIPGALPILMGFVSASGEVLAPGGIYLFFLLFFWQMPHFWVLALRFSDDYAKGGVPTLPVARGQHLTTQAIVIWCLAYCALALGAPLFFRVGSIYLFVTIALCAKLLYELRAYAGAGEKIANPESKFWLRFFLWVNFSLIGFIGAIVVDLWSVYLIRHVKADDSVSLALGVVPGVERTFEFPEERTYSAADRGFSKYGAKSIHGKMKVALTFDDGPSATETPRLLDILRKYGVKATFFMLGDRIDGTTEGIVRRVLREGHLVAVHSMHHQDANTMGLEAFKQTLWKPLTELFPLMAREGIVQKEVYFRFPYGAYGKSKGYHHLNAMRELSYEKYGENCINFVFWNVDSEDWVPDMTPTNIADGVVSQIVGGTAYEHVKLSTGKFVKHAFHIDPKKAPRGGVILIHDSHAKSVDSVAGLLEKLDRAGVEIVPLNSIKEYSFAGKTCRLKSDR